MNWYALRLCRARVRNDFPPGIAEDGFLSCSFGQEDMRHACPVCRQRRERRRK